MVADVFAAGSGNIVMTFFTAVPANCNTGFITPPVPAISTVPQLPGVILLNAEHFFGAVLLYTAQNELALAFLRDGRLHR